MSRFDNINLGDLPPPQVIEALDFETVLAALKTDYAARFPAFTADLESEPVVKLLEVSALREVTLRSRVNDAARAVMLAFANGSDLEHIGSFYGVARQVLDAGDPLAVPPVLPTLEDDTSLRRRIQLAPEALSVAGSRGGYIFNGLSAGEIPARVTIDAPEPGRVLIEYEFPADGISARVKGIEAFMSNPGEVTIVVLGWDGNGIPDAAVLAAVEAHLSDNHVRPMGDTVIVQPVEVITYDVNATLEVREGPQLPLVQAAAEAALQAYVARQHRIGLRITDSGLDDALTVEGVEKVRLAAFADIEPSLTQTAYCNSFSVTVELASA